MPKSIKPRFEEMASSFKDVYQRITLDARTTDGANRVKLDCPMFIMEVRTYVRGLLNGTIPMDFVIEHSYIHRNGFQKIVLGRIDGFAMRYHRYLPGEGDQNVHDHRWSRMDSLILEGTLVADYLKYSESSEHGAQKWQRHAYSKIGEDYVVKHEGESYLAPDKCVHHRRGELYSMDSRRLHRILPSTEPVATLVVTHPVPEERVWCNLFQTRIIEVQEPVHEVRLTKQQMIGALTHLETLLTQQLEKKVDTATLQGVWA